MAKSIDSSAKELIRTSPESWAKLSHLVSEHAEITTDDTDTSTIVGASDKVTKVREENQTRYLIMEFQAQYDEKLLGCCSLREEVLRKSKGDIVADTVIFFAHQNALPGDPELGKYVQRRYAGPPSIFHYTAIKLWELDPDTILSLDPHMAPVAALAKIDLNELPALIGRIEQKIASLPSQEEQNQLWSIAYWLAGVKWRNRTMLDTLFEGKFKMIDSVTYQGTREDAKIEYGKDIILEMIQEKFGEVPETLEQKIRSLNDFERVNSIRRDVLKAQSLDEIIAFLK